MIKKYCIWLAWRSVAFRDILQLYGDLRTVFTTGEDVIITDSDNNDGNYNILAVLWQPVVESTRIEIALNALTDVDPFPHVLDYPCPGVQYNPTSGKPMYNATTKKVIYVGGNLFGKAHPE